MGKIYRQLDIGERAALMLAVREDGFSIRAVARKLGRHASTISRELKRNAVVGLGDFGYCAHTSAAQGFQRRRRGGRKLGPATPLWDYVVEHLRCGWSPGQIAGRLKELIPGEIRCPVSAQTVSHETIYQAIFALPKGELKADLLKALRHAGPKRRPRSGGKKRASVLGDFLPIHARPAEVEDRIIPGHWEADLIKGKGNKSAVATLVERTTRLTILARLPDASATSVLEALTTALEKLPPSLRQTLTYDRGTEMAQHAQLTDRLGIKVYFCDPYSPWQRGTNENTNGLIRQYLPKSTDLSFATQEYLDDIAYALNTRPRAALKFQMPIERFRSLLQDHPGKYGVAVRD